MHDNRIGVVVATALSVTIVVGAGLLTLPGLSFSLAGKEGYVPWLIVAVLMLPLLYVFSYFAAHNPSAGGVTGYIRSSLGQRFASMAEMIVLGTFTLGIPAISFIGAEYLKQAVPSIAVVPGAFFIMCLAYGAGVIGLRISGAIQTAIAACIILGLSAVAVVYLFEVDWQSVPSGIPGNGIPYKGIASAIPIVLFAFTGWEMTAFLAEDMKNPKRDMPRSIWISFAIVVAVYIFIAWTVAYFGENTASWKLTPFIELAHLSFGEYGGVLVGVLAAFISIANVVAAFMSASRAIYSAGRDGFLPNFIGRTNADHKPLVAMTVTWLLFSMIIFITYELGVGEKMLLQLAGQNFFVLYLLCSFGFVRVNYRNPHRLIVGVVAIISVLMMLLLFNMYGVIYCSCLAGVGLLLSRKVPDRGKVTGQEK